LYKLQKQREKHIRQKEQKDSIFCALEIEQAIQRDDNANIRYQLDK